MEYLKSKRVFEVFMQHIFLQKYCLKLYNLDSPEQEFLKLPQVNANPAL